LKKQELITSRRHALVGELRAVRDDRDSALMFLEGPRLVKEILRQGNPVEVLAWTPAAETTHALDSLLDRVKRTFQLSESVFEAISDVGSPQGILAIAERPHWTWTDLWEKVPAPLVILDGIQDPGNVSTIIRTAEAAGAAGLVTTPGTAHLFSPKGLRGAMGSTLRLPSLEHQPIQTILSEISRASYALAASTMRSPERTSDAYTRIDWKKPWAILLGQEGKGISAEWQPHIRQFVHIPMQATVESLNVAAAAAILLYESARHRHPFD